MNFSPLLVPKLCLGTRLSPQLRCPVRASTHIPRPTAETEFRWPRRRCTGQVAAGFEGEQWHSQTEFGNEEANFAHITGGHL